MGREYPAGYDYFRERLKTAFRKNQNETEPEKIDELLARGQYITKEIEALYMLKKYRTLKRRYYEDDEMTEATRVKIIEDFAKK